MGNAQINPCVKKEYRDDPFHQVSSQCRIARAIRQAPLSVRANLRGDRRSHSVKVILTRLFCCFYVACGLASLDYSLGVYIVVVSLSFHICDPELEDGVCGSVCVCPVQTHILHGLNSPLIL